MNVLKSLFFFQGFKCKDLLLSGECVISSVLSCCSKNLKRGQTSVIAQFYWQEKENTSSRREGRPTQKTQREEKPPAQFWLLFFVCFFLLPLRSGYPEGLFVLLEVLTLIFGPFLCSIFTGFSLFSLLATAILDSFFLF